MTWALAGRWLWNIVAFCIPVPIALIAAAYAWFQIDKHSAVRKAVDKAVTEMVAGSQIAALEAQLEASERTAAFERGRAEAFEDATQKFDQARQEAEQETERLDNELDALKAAPPPAACDVTDDLINRLR